MRLTKRLLRPDMPPLIARMEEEREILAERLRAAGDPGHHGQCAEAQALKDTPACRCWIW